MSSELLQRCVLVALLIGMAPTLASPDDICLRWQEMMAKGASPQVIAADVKKAEGAGYQHLKSVLCVAQPETSAVQIATLKILVNGGSLPSFARADLRAAVDPPPPSLNVDIEKIRCSEFFALPAETRKRVDAATTAAALSAYTSNGEEVYINALGLQQAFQVGCAADPSNLAIRAKVRAIAEHDRTAGGASPPNDAADAIAFGVVLETVANAARDISLEPRAPSSSTRAWDGTFEVAYTFESINPFELTIYHHIRCGGLLISDFTVTEAEGRFNFHMISGSSLTEVASKTCAEAQRYQ